MNEAAGARGKVAVTLMLKDEATEILPWLGWYLELGADTIFVYDDSSSDGTWELLQQASRVADIRPFRLAPSNESFISRQAASYTETLRRYQNDFDWIGFFDSDEYLALYQHRTLQEFLDRPADISSVSINWCNYNSAGHVFRPTCFPFVAYTRHFSTEERINHLVKSFVRPKDWIGTWLNPHFFDVGDRRIVDAAGRDIVWGSDKAVTRDPPDWSVAKVMHYQCRSMEHFIDRMRKRDDLKADTQLWREYDRGGETDERPIARQDTVRRWVHSSLTTPVPGLADMLRHRASEASSPLPAQAGLLSRIRTILTPQAEAEAEEKRAQLAFDVLLPRGINRQMLTFDPASGMVYVTDGNAPVQDIVCGIRLATRPDRLFLVRPLVHDAPIVFAGDGRLSGCVAVDIVELSDSTAALCHPHTRRYLSVEPRMHGEVRLDRRFAKDWETFVFVSIPRETIPYSPLVEFVDRLLLARNPAIFVAERLDSDDGRLAMTLLPLWIECLGADLAAAVRTYVGGVAGYML